MQELHVRDWVQTERTIGRIASINPNAMTANIDALDDSREGLVVLTFPLERLLKIDVEKYLPQPH